MTLKFKCDFCLFFAGDYFEQDDKSSESAWYHANSCEALWGNIQDDVEVGFLFNIWMKLAWYCLFLIVRPVLPYVTQQKGHDVGQVYSEIMSKTVCKIQRK